MPAFSQRAPDELHAAMRAFLNTRPWLSQNDLVNGAIASMIGFPDFRVETAPPTLRDYLNAGAMDTVAFETLRSAIQRGKVVGVFGPRGSGRTSLLKALVNEYQQITSSARRAMVATIVPGEFKKLTPLLTMALTDSALRSKGIASIPEWIESVFTDDLSPGEMPAVIESWKGGVGGAFTMCASSISIDSPGLDSVTEVSVLMRDGTVAMLIDRLSHQDTHGGLDAKAMRESSIVEPAYVFAQLFAHFFAAGRIKRAGPNSGKSPSSMTRRASISYGDSQVGLLEISTVMIDAQNTERRLTWTSNSVLRDGIVGERSITRIFDFNHGVAVIDNVQ